MLRKLGKYEILDEIGHGGMATVYRARDTRLDRLVAIKIMHPHLRAAPEARVRFAREARSVAKLRHPNILEIYDSSEEDSEEAYIVTELLTGPTLKEFAEAQPEIPAEIAACFAIEIARALSAAHEAGIVHRDVKPENVLLHEDRCVKLTDFGIAQMVDSQSFTATGQILGSPGHMAPEQVDGGDCDHRTDHFSLGTVLYYLSTGRLPFSGRNPHQVLKRIVDVDYPDPLRVRPAIGGKLRAIIERSLARDPDDRYQTAEGFEQDLVAFVQEAGIEDSSAMLARYLPDPDLVSRSLRADLVERLIARGKAASDAGEVPAALDDFNRVLALDEGNQQVLELIERIGRRSRQRTILLVAGALLGVFGLGAMGYAMFGAARPTNEGDVVPVAVGDPPDSIVDASIVPEPEQPADAGLERLAVLVDDAGSPDAGVQREERRTVAVVEGTVRQRAEVYRGGGEPRTVQFSLTPCQDVKIGVDGAEPRPYGPSFRSIDLEPGPHRFVFVPSEGSQCDGVEASVTVEPGAEPFLLRQRIGFQPAGLYVSANVAEAQVAVDEGRVTGRANHVLYVPLDSSTVVHRITVTAPDHVAYTGNVRLSAGQLTRHPVTLPASGSAP